MKDHLDFSVKISILQVKPDNILHLIESFTIARSELHYRAEGNANIVLSLPTHHKVLRLPKYEQTLYSNDRTKAPTFTLWILHHMSMYFLIRF